MGRKGRFEGRVWEGKEVRVWEGKEGLREEFGKDV